MAMETAFHFNSGSLLNRSLFSFTAWASLVAQWYSTCLPMQEMQVPSLGWGDPLEKGMVTHSGGRRSLAGYRVWGRKESERT